MEQEKIKKVDKDYFKRYFQEHKQEATKKFMDRYNSDEEFRKRVLEHCKKSHMKTKEKLKETKRQKTIDTIVEYLKTKNVELNMDDVLELTQLYKTTKAYLYI